MNKEMWTKIQTMLNKSDYKLVIFDGDTEIGQAECEELNVPKDSVLECVITNCNGVCIDNWIRILGQGNEKHHGVAYYNNLSDESLSGMLIVANDVVGGIYAINISRFENEKDMVWYFAPDTLEWESLEINYTDFLAFAAHGDLTGFYKSMRWKNWSAECEKIGFDEGCSIYPFLWANECKIDTADKKAVPFEEIMQLNFDNCKELENI